jgi:hypothetical protein
MGKNGEPRNKPMHIWSTSFSQVYQEHNREMKASLINGKGNTGYPHGKE